MNPFTPTADIENTLKKFGFKPEELEIRRDLKTKTGYPKSERVYRLEFESTSHNVEDMYYWMMGFLRDDLSYPILHKITDSKAASSASSAFGDIQSRIGIQQNSASNYLATLGKLVKDLFKLVRELRQVDERCQYYLDAKGNDKEKARKAENTLRDAWITLVEGGTQNPGSVFGMAQQQVGFTILPDLFFQAPPFIDKDQIDAHVNGLDFNNQVKEALRRKLYQFTVWKEKTDEELKAKKKFQIGYLRQHYETILMYIEWVKPYLKNLRHLHMKDVENDAMLVEAFEASMTEIEVIATKEPLKIYDDPSKNVYPVVMTQFVFRTKPIMAFQQQRNQGALHIGRTEVFIRAYAWTGKDIENYKKYRQQENFDMIANLDTSLRETMEFLGEDLKKYLKESGSTIGLDLYKDVKEEVKESKKEEKTPGIKENLAFATMPFQGMYDLALAPFFGDLKRKKKSDDDNVDLSEAKKDATMKAFLLYNIYKKAHRMLSW